MLKWEDKRQLVKVATLYYSDGLTQDQIAKKMKVSRPVISKLLQKAKDVGIVEVYIKEESVLTIELEQALEKQFDLDEVVVVPNLDLSPELSRRAVGQAAANFLSNNIKDINSIGISWGTTLADMVKHYPYERRDEIKVVPLEGGMGRKYAEIHANQLASELAKKINGTCYYLYAPAILETVELKERLMEMEDIKAVLEEGRNVDIALIGIGNPHQSSTLLEIGYLKEIDLAYLREIGAVGDIGFRFFDKNGKPVNDDLNKKVIGVSLEQLRDIKQVIAVVEGAHKLDSVSAALIGGYINTLIIDEKTASAIIKKSKKS